MAERVSRTNLVALAAMVLLIVGALGTTPPGVETE
jgi:hypothetical protein